MKHLLPAFIFILQIFNVDAQTIPTGQCGLQYTYDANGNLTSREYVCVNNPKSTALGADRMPKEINTIITQQVDALYPNPTTGQFTVRFTLPLDDAVIRILDLNGRVLQQFRATGALLNGNIGKLVPGMYYIQVVDKNTNMLEKIIKQ